MGVVGTPVFIFGHVICTCILVFRNVQMLGVPSNPTLCPPLHSTRLGTVTKTT